MTLSPAPGVRFAPILGPLLVLTVYAALGFGLFFVFWMLALHDEGARVTALEFAFGPGAACVLAWCASLAWPRLYWAWGVAYATGAIVLPLFLPLGHGEFEFFNVLRWGAAFGFIYAGGVIGGLLGRRVALKRDHA